MRCLNDEGSLFIFGSYHNSGLINRLGSDERVCDYQRDRLGAEERTARTSQRGVCKHRIKTSCGSRRTASNIGSTTGFASEVPYDDWLSKPNQQ